MIGLFLLGAYVGGVLYALASSAFVMTHGTHALNDDLRRAWNDDPVLRERLLRSVTISAVLWPIAVVYMASGRPPPW